MQELMPSCSLRQAGQMMEDQADSGVAGLSSSKSGFHQFCFKFTLGILGQLCFLTHHSGWWMEVEEEEAVKMIQKSQKLLKFQIDLQVVEERVADEVETQVVFLMTHVSFSSFFVLQPNQLGAGQSDHGPLTSPGLCTASCDLHELRRIFFPYAVVKNLFYVSFWQISEAIPGWSLNGPVNSIRDNFIHCFAHLMGNIKILQFVQSRPMFVQSFLQG
ncbi:hypothetical protein Tco_0111610 [Tanacetum coccineum]